jgi:hypothetical protein
MTATATQATMPARYRLFIIRFDADTASGLADSARYHERRGEWDKARECWMEARDIWELAARQYCDIAGQFADPDPLYGYTATSVYREAEYASQRATEAHQRAKDARDISTLIRAIAGIQAV